MTLKSVRFGNFLFAFILLLPGTGYSQYANEWMRPGQIYYRLPIAHKGIYRLSYVDLQNAGIPGSIDPRLIQLFHRGKEQSIFVQGQSDAVLNTDDYIEFYAQANDGTLDQKLYKPITAQPHNYYNLFTDSTAYFLTWSTTGVAGKRVTFFDEVNVTNIPKEAFHNEERIIINKTQYSGGETQSDVNQYTHFDVGEGWTGNAISQSQFIDYNIDQIENTETSSGTPQLELLIVGRDQIPHNVEILVGQNSSALRSASTQSFSGFQSITVNIPLMWSDIDANGRMTVRIVAAPDVTNRPQVSVSYIKLLYPQTFQSGALIEKNFYLKVQPTSKSYVEWANAPSSMRVWDVTDPTSIVAIGTRLGANSLTSVIGSTNVPRILYAFTTTHTAALHKVSIRFIDPQQANYIIISNQQLMKPALTYSDPVKAYAGYRASSEGGSYDTLVVSMDQLYNQFNYGETSPLAIYEFMRYMVENGEPKYLFLIGKGRDVNAGFHRIINPGPEIIKDLVPSAGLPASDMNYTVGLGESTYESAVPTGRLSVTTPIEVANYLNKIKETENPNVILDWQKRGLHLSGGIAAYELPRFRSYMDGFKTIGEGIYWGASIKTIAKREPSQVEVINIAEEINEGVNLVTFYGHSSPGTIDIDIGKVTDPVMGYNNAGKYPIFLINGCNAGSFFLNGELFGENWVNAANRGARNFIAHSSYGFESTLRSYSDFFYKIGFADSTFLKKGVGDVQKEVARQYMRYAQPSMRNITQVQQMILLGDPAVRMLEASDPDYKITNSSLSLFTFDDKPITALTDSLAIRIIVQNLGVVKNKPVKINVTRTFNNGLSETYDSTFAPLFYQDTLLFKIYRNAQNGSGSNTFLVQLDPENKIKESNEDNNEALLTANISSSITLNLLPHKFGIENQTTVKFIWQSSNTLDATRDFQFEIDTALSFNSAFKKQIIQSGKVLVSTTVELLELDSTVYYWRTRFHQPTSDESNEWSVSSFSYIKDGQEGWAQLMKDQAKDNFFNSLVNEGNGTPFKFEENKTSIEITTFGNNHPLPYTDVSVKIDHAEYNLATQGQPCRNNTINFIAFRKTTAVPYAGLPFNFQDPRTCGREPQLINSFTQSELETGLGDDLTALVSAIDISDSVVMFSIGDPGYAGWSAAIKTRLGELGVGVADLNSMQAGEPVIIFGKKGTPPGSAAFYKSPLTPGNEQLILVSKEITGRKTEGIMKSALIGPAQQWIQFMNVNPMMESSDQVAFSIYGVNPLGIETILASDVESSFDLSTIQPDQFPFLRLTYEAKDEINLTPSDWKNWVVTYEPVAEGVLLFKGNRSPQYVKEGDHWNTQFAFANISTKNFKDSLYVETVVLTKENQQSFIKNFRIKKPAPGDTTFFDVASETIGKAGTNDVNVFVNNKKEPEMYYDNNFTNLSNYLNIDADNIDPVLEVTIDGREIRNGDFVSTSPIILLRLMDENPFMLKKDTIGMTILLSDPCTLDSCPFKRIAFSSQDVKWFPATTTSDFRVEFTPANLADGVYTLSIQASDASGNFSGESPYLISFQVKSESILNFKGVYPNPSSVGFFFNFELTGNTLPDEFELEIFSLTGQLVNRFGTEDVYRFYIGTNEIVWDGADATGKTLTNGVYLYRLHIKANDNNSITTGRLIWLR